ncbi:hypothetical protein IFM89_029731 [Coptis chinensis]|uniref:Uncharacterized protein n=1 Tax=Coptis chinensis TaxID=261450 RepID=A0A835I8M5_9MAGN|nr:hypothetical protein IFM89_029731 [Coptis chinensis]
MMFHIQIAETHEEVLRYLPMSGIIGLILWWEMFFILDNETIPLLPTQRNTTSLRYTVHARKGDYNEVDDRPAHASRSAVFATRGGAPGGNRKAFASALDEHKLTFTRLSYQLGFLPLSIGLA